MKSSGATESGHGAEVDLGRVTRLWAPLAASWMLMALEPTIVIAAVSRLPDPKIHLAAWSSIVFPVSLVVEGPIIMMLAAATRLSTGWTSYRAVMRYGHAMCLALTALHAAIAFTPLYDLVAVDVLGSDPSVVEPGRLGLALMLPWTYAIGYRRAQQGTLIRFERSGAVGVGTLLRLCTTGSMLAALATFTAAPGVAVAGGAVASGVTAEALYAGWKVRSVHPELHASSDDAPLPPRAFLRFYAPLAVTPLITLFIQPIGAAAMNRMPRALDSVAAWGPVHALVFTMRSVGMAFNEVVVTLVALGGGRDALRRFGRLLAAATSSILVLVWATPLSALWFGKIQGIPDELVPMARLGVGVCASVIGRVVRAWTSKPWNQLCATW